MTLATLNHVATLADAATNLIFFPILLYIIDLTFLLRFPVGHMAPDCIIVNSHMISDFLLATWPLIVLLGIPT